MSDLTEYERGYQYALDEVESRLEQLRWRLRDDDAMGETTTAVLAAVSLVLAAIRDEAEALRECDDRVARVRESSR